MKARVIAMYLPQYHPIPLNDEWWGKGFTEWTNVASAKPLFRGHYQPRIPADLGFYDLRMPEIREAQAELAREAGIEGFMYWHYWFGKGKRLLERPFNEVLESGSPDYPFCLGWANHSWSKKTWTAKNDGGKNPQLLEQTYIEEEYVDHFHDVLPAFKDPRYITVDGKPFFMIYDTLSLPDARKFINIWNKLAVENGLKGIHFVAYTLGHKAEARKSEIMTWGFDACVSSRLVDAEIKSVSKVGMYWQKFKTRKLNMGPERYKYKDIIKYILNNEDKQENYYPLVFSQLDRSPRAGKKAIILTGATPKLFGKYLSDTIDLISAKQDEHKIILVNAWNEWGEGMYIEPDLKFGKGYLEEIRKALITD